MIECETWGEDYFAPRCSGNGERVDVCDFAEARCDGVTPWGKPVERCSHAKPMQAISTTRRPGAPTFRNVYGDARHFSEIGLNYMRRMMGYCETMTTPDDSRPRNV